MKKILIANRGEIAIRVMRTAKKMGIKTVAIYSTIDRNAPHVKYADEAVLIGEAPSNQSYLLGDKIIEVAKSLNVDAIHPGYGFLSENAEFAESCEANNIIFIGPKSKAIKIMGSKLAAKEAVKHYNIPMVPGTEEAITDIPEAKKIAKEIGFPILIKASAGGGGKGMRIVEKEENFESQMNRAISEATSAFGDGSVFIEKYVTSPRHIEIQVMADTHGNIIHLFERECSIQRRHQKVVEEAPSSVLTPELRNKMGEAAIKVAKACDYIGAGTVEFLLDGDHNFYFLEMNTRLQVEHPVTELISNTDLVELQIRVARGEALPLSQSDLKINGHALELRVYAEDPLNDFLPSVGNLEVYKLPVGKNIRVDNGFEEGMDVPIYYDPMLSKLITYGKTREEAIELMISAIADYHIQGIETTLPFGSFVCKHEAFRSGNFDTHFVKKFYSPEALKESQEAEAKIAAMIAVKQYLADQKLLRVPLK
ncbi:acetyl-CoA carboxylase biotin carboxylase subunit [Bizionia sp.]|uniref:acetyl-CoA carboxylase biotin carboxylase subunit n=1 Tax=Bizionia sp. TaxID=1954480 RepID=UPI003A904F45